MWQTPRASAWPHPYPGTPTLAFSKSRSLPMVVSRRQRHSRDSSSWFLSSLTTQSCMIASVNIFNLNNSPINLIFPNERRRAMSRASSSSSFRRPRSSACRSCQKDTSHSVKTFPPLPGFLNLALSTHILRQRTLQIPLSPLPLLQLRSDWVKSWNWEGSFSHRSSFIHLFLLLLKNLIIIFVFFKLLLTSI